MDDSIASPKLVVEIPTNGSHGPWMLMSYKNKKHDTVQNDPPKRQDNSSSRFSILVNDAEDTDKDIDSNPKKPIIAKVSISC